MVGGPLLEEELDELEVALIKEHGTLAPGGYNVQVGGKVAWRGVEGLARRAKRGPVSAEQKAKQRATWARKREAKWEADGLSEAQKETKRHNYLMRVANEERHRLGIPLDDTSFGPRHRNNYWGNKNRARL